MDGYRATLVQDERTLDRAIGDDDAPEDDDIGHQAPPVDVGQAERRMQVRAYNHWTSLLGACSLPRIEDLALRAMPDFARNAVVLDFSAGTDDPAVAMLGDRLAEECGARCAIHRLSEVPKGSLLSRITDRYRQILADQAPIGFEAEFVNAREKTVVYRGMLLPFAGRGTSDGAQIEHVMGVINWKELADAATTAGLIDELDRAAACHCPASPPLGEWADGPAAGEPAAADGSPVEDASSERESRQERKLRRANARDAKRAQLVDELRALPTTAWADAAPVASEFAVMLVRRMPDGSLRLIGEANQDSRLIERASRPLRRA